MKNLYPKGKGKIHPSPAAPLAAGGYGGGSSSPSHDALAVLKLLPAAIVALTAALTYEDKEVLAYLVTQSIHGLERNRCREAAAAASRPLFDCGCFDCYTSFWSRWDCSPGRELIHQAIEAFEEHLARSEKKGRGGGKGRRRERKAGNRAEKGKEKEKERREAAEVEAGVAEEEKLVEASAVVSGPASFSGEVKEASEMAETATAVVGGEAKSGEEAAALGGERRRGWPDLTGFFNSCFWSLWGPGV